MQLHTKTLPRSAWESVVIKENSEAVVGILSTDKLIFDKQIQVREKAAHMLVMATQNLPEDFCLKVVCGIRTLQEQRVSWQRKTEELMKIFPEATVDEIEQKVSLVVARPNPLANHNCGGAVDVCLVHSDGTIVDMGTPIGGGDPRMNTMFSSEISHEQVANREILRRCMEVAGFIWYPGEWWHYCYGDRMWAVYSGKNECCYGPLTY